jgi:anti-anti-sigma factor
MQIMKEVRNGVTILTPSGYMVASTIDSFRKVINQIQNDKTSRIILDMGKIRMIDSAGIGTIVKLVKTCKNTGCEVKITSLLKHIREAFDMLRLNKVMDIYMSLEEAFKSYALIENIEPQVTYFVQAQNRLAGNHSTVIE